MLNLAAYRDTGGRRILVEEDSEHLEGQWRLYLDLEQSRFNISAVKLRVGAGTGRTELKVVVVEWPRAACRVYWSFIAVYVALGLDLFKGTPSRWSSSGFLTCSWANFLVTLGIEGSLMRSQAYDSTGD